MNSQISFYSFKNTENNSRKPNIRKDKQSHFEEFRQLRMQERLKQRENYIKPKAISQSILVRSRQEKEMLSFLRVPNLPEIKLKGKKRAKSKRNPQLLPSALQKVLSNKTKFMRTYFRTLDNAKKQSKQVITHTFPEIFVHNWSIKGFMRGQSLIVKATNPFGQQKYLKFHYSKRFQDIREGYQQFIKDRFQEQLMNHI